MNNAPRYSKAVELFGANVVAYVVEVVELSDPDGACVLFEDEKQWEHAECVRFMYFDE